MRGWGDSHREGDRKFWTEVSSAWFLARGDKDRLNGTFEWKFSWENVGIGGSRSRFYTLEAILRCFFRQRFDLKTDGLDRSDDFRRFKTPDLNPCNSF